MPRCGRPPSGINDHREFVEGLFIDGYKTTEIEQELLQQKGVKVAARSIAKRLGQWGYTVLRSAAGNMVYSWEGKEEICRQLYVVDGRSLQEVVNIMRDEYDFMPSKRAFQVQFKRWNFPGKHHPAYQEPELVERIEQLWQKNTQQTEMLDILHAEGWDVNLRSMMRLRAKHGWLLRVPNGGKGYGAEKGGDGIPTGIQNEEGENDPRVEDAATDNGNNADDQGQARKRDFARMAGGYVEDSPTTNETAHASQHNLRLPPESNSESAARLQELREQSDALWANKKRRRRTRGYAGLPADPPAPPRFPSETTLDESKAYLHMDNDAYRAMREQFQKICEEAGFRKKTEAGSDQWQAAKNKLIAENEHLSKQFHGPFDGVPTENKSLALDVVCTDVTKRMRTAQKTLTIAEAKNIVGLNPQEGRVVRRAFYEMLKANNFKGKLEMGDEQWNRLKQKWIDESDILQRILGPNEDDPAQAEKVKALTILSRDVMKRLRDDQNRLNPAGKRPVNEGPGPGAAPPFFPNTAGKRKSATAAQAIANSTSAKAAPGRRQQNPRQQSAALSSPYSPRSAQPTQQQRQQRQQPYEEISNLQIDPSLLAAASEKSLAERLQEYSRSSAAVSMGQSESQAQTTTAPAHAPLPPRQQLPRPPPPPPPSRNQAQAQAQAQPSSSRPQAELIWFRLHPSSTATVGEDVWLGMLPSLDMHSLRIAALKGRTGVRIEKVWGIVTDKDSGSESAVELDRNGRVGAYLDFVGSGNGVCEVQVVQD